MKSRGLLVDAISDEPESPQSDETGVDDIGAAGDEVPGALASPRDAAPPDKHTRSVLLRELDKEARPQLKVPRSDATLMLKENASVARLCPEYVGAPDAHAREAVRERTTRIDDIRLTVEQTAEVDDLEELRRTVTNIAKQHAVVVGRLRPQDVVRQETTLEGMRLAAEDAAAARRSERAVSLMDDADRAADVVQDAAASYKQFQRKREEALQEEERRLDVLFRKRFRRAEGQLVHRLIRKQGVAGVHYAPLLDEQLDEFRLTRTVVRQRGVGAESSDDDEQDLDDECAPEKPAIAKWRRKKRPPGRAPSIDQLAAKTAMIGLVDVLARRFRVEWRHAPQPIRIRAEMLRAVRSKLDPGHYSLHVSLVEAVGGVPLAWSRLRAEQCGMLASTEPVFYTGGSASVSLLIEQDIFLAVPAPIDAIPQNALLFELYRMQEGDRFPCTRAVAWGVHPLVNSVLDLVQGKRKLPLARGDTMFELNHYREYEEVFSRDLDNWLANLYFETTILSRYNTGQREYQSQLLADGAEQNRLEHQSRLSMVRQKSVDWLKGKQAAAADEPVIDNRWFDEVEWSRDFGVLVYSAQRGPIDDPEEEAAKRRMMRSAGSLSSLLRSSRIGGLATAASQIALGNRPESQMSAPRDPNTFARQAGTIGRWLTRLRIRMSDPPVNDATAEEPAREMIAKFDSADVEFLSDEDAMQNSSRTVMRTGDIVGMLRGSSDKRSSAHIRLRLRLDPDDAAGDTPGLEARGASSVLGQYVPFVHPPATGLVDNRGFPMSEAFRKLSFLKRALAPELGWMRRTSRGFRFNMMILLTLMLYIRLFVHGFGQWLFLLLFSFPVRQFSFAFDGPTLEYQNSVISLPLEVGVVALGPLSIIGCALFISGLAYAFMRLSGRRASRGLSALALDCWIISALDVPLQALYDLAYRGLYDSADVMKLFTWFQRREGTGVVGVFATLLLFVAIEGTAVFALYNYVMNVHMGGRLFELFVRLDDYCRTFYVPHDLEMPLDELRAACKHAQKYTTESGAKRLVKISRLRFCELLDETKTRIIDYVAIFNQDKSDDILELHRHFLHFKDANSVYEISGARTLDEVLEHERIIVVSVQGTNLSEPVVEDLDSDGT